MLPTLSRLKIRYFFSFVRSFVSFVYQYQYQYEYEYEWLLGLCLAKMKKLSMAFDDFDVAIEMEPNNPNHYFSRLISVVLCCYVI